MVKEKLLLIAFGSLLGALPIAGYLWFMSASSQGTSYSSLGELRAAMLQRDERDVKDDRSVSLRSIIAPHPSDEIIYDLRPGLDVKFQGARVTTNSCGMRGPDRPVRKEPGTFRIALLGDSFAFGWGVEYEQSFAHVLEGRLNEALGGAGRVEVLNFGVPGYSTFQEVAKLRETGLDFDPDLVLVYFIENDFGLPFFLGGPEGGLMSAVDYAKKIWNRADAGNEKEKSFLRTLLDPNRVLAKLDKELRERGIPLYVAVNPGKGWESTVQRLWVLRRSRSIRTVPMRERLLDEIKKRGLKESELRLPTDPHPSAIKHRLLGEILGDGLKERVLSGRTSPS